MSMIKQKILSSAKVIAHENELKPGAIKVETCWHSILVPFRTTPAQKIFTTFLKPESKLALKLAGFVYCELH